MEISLLVHSSSKFFNETQFFMTAGCEESNKSLIIYKHIEEKHEFITALLIKITAATTATTMAASAMSPISYAIFSYPPPQMWPLTLEIQ